MKKIVLILILIVLLILSGCDNPVSVDAKLNQEFKLNVGQNAELQDEFLRIKFVAVTEDSRCPANLRCFIPGNAAVAFMIQQNKDLPAKDTLNTYLDPRDTWFKSYQIFLVKLEPYPQTTEQIPQSNYTATFLIKVYPVH